MSDPLRALHLTANVQHFTEVSSHFFGLSFSSFPTGGLVLMYRSPIRYPWSFPTRDCTSPVASSFPRRSIWERSTCNTRLDV